MLRGVIESTQKSGGFDLEETDRAVIIGRDGRWLSGWALRFIILAAAAWLLWQGLGYIWVGLLPILLAILVCTVLWPPVRWLRKHHFPPALATITTILGAFAIFGGIIALIAPSVVQQSQELFKKAEQAAYQGMDWLQGEPFHLDKAALEGPLNAGFDWVKGQSTNIATGVFTGLSAASSVAVTLVVMLVLSFFFLKDGVKFLPWLRKFTGKTAGWHLTEVLTRTWNTLAGFVRAQALVSFVDALFIGVGLVVLKVPLALALAVITFFAGFVPIVGAITAGALAVAIALVSNGVTTAVLVLGLIILVQQLESHILSPIIQSKAMNLHAAVVLLSVMVGSTLFGIVGAFLAVPVAATLAVWFRYHAELVSLRAGEITIDDIEIATAKGEQMSGSEAFAAVRERMAAMGRRKPESEKKPAHSSTSLSALRSEQKRKEKEREGGVQTAAPEIPESSESKDS
ncbi:AI-2E family transporter [Corynebacterium poyangense]|uniref:AI-2E family transporter n=1 Tax=Corynebacterium poyangense TaxID=2684405 RepID=A0A7H0SRG9_9CORY|nr:AI-2E family transporter [Corynebacterium poyangense]